MSSASVLTILAFTVERYVAICHPLRAQAVSTPTRAVKTLIVLWIGAFLSSLPYPVHTRTYYYLDDPRHSDGRPLADSLVCNIPLSWMAQMKYVVQASTLLLFVAPMCVMTVLYVLIAVALRRRSTARALCVSGGRGEDSGGLGGGRGEGLGDGRGEDDGRLGGGRGEDGGRLGGARGEDGGRLRGDTNLLRRHDGSVTADQPRRLSPIIRQSPNSRRTVVRILGQSLIVVCSAGCFICSCPACRLRCRLYLLLCRLLRAMLKAALANPSVLTT